jgi:hypothetical protein
MKQSPFVCGGPVGLDAETYIVRGIETDAYTAIQKKNYISIFGSRQVGKTSLLHRLQDRVERQYDYATALIDLSSINDPNISFRDWSHQLCELITDQIRPFLGKNKPPESPRDSVGFRTFWGKLATSINKPSLWILLDEANSVPVRFNDPFYGILRSIYNNQRSTRPESNLKNINFAFAGVFEPEKLVLNRDNSPFNVGKKIRLGDFTQVELSKLTNILHECLGIRVPEEWIYQWTNGHPYLSQVLFDLTYQHVVKTGSSQVNEAIISSLIPKLLDEASDNIDHTIKLVLNDPEKRKVMTQLAGNISLPFSRAKKLTAFLELDGIIKDNGVGKIMIRNKLYEQSLKMALDIPAGVNMVEDVSRTEIFISYSHADDEQYIKRLHIHLDSLKRKNKIVLWDDFAIEPGKKWRDEIQSALSRAKIAILMVSPDFLASSFINDHELPHILRAAEQDGLIIVWIPVSSSAYKDSLIEPYQAILDPKKPLDKMSNSEMNEALVSVYEKVKKLIQP